MSIREINFFRMLWTISPTWHRSRSLRGSRAYRPEQRQSRYIYVEKYSRASRHRREREQWEKESSESTQRAQWEHTHTHTHSEYREKVQSRSVRAERAGQKETERGKEREWDITTQHRVRAEQDRGGRKRVQGGKQLQVATATARGKALVGQGANTRVRTNKGQGTTTSKDKG